MVAVKHGANAAAKAAKAATKAAKAATTGAFKKVWEIYEWSEKDSIMRLFVEKQLALKNLKGDQQAQLDVLHREIDLRVALLKARKSSDKARKSSDDDEDT
jgi:hypothetical protein